MLYTVIEWVYNVCCMVCMVCVGEWTFHWTVKSWKRFVVAGVVYAIGFAFSQVKIDNVIPCFLLLYIGEIVAWTIICEGKLGNRLFKIMVIFYGVGIVEAGFGLLLELLLGVGVAKEVMPLIGILLTIGSLIIVTKQRWYQKLIKYIQILPKRGSVLILFAIIGGTAIVAYGNMVQEIVEEDWLVWLFRVILVTEMFMVVGIVIWLIWESIQKKYYLEQNALKEEILHTQQEYYQTVYEKDREMRNFRHDVASQLGLLKVLLEKGEIEKAKEQLEGVHREFEQASFLKIQVGDEMLDAILSMMNRKAVEKGIRLEVHGRIKGEKKYDIYELCTIFSNAIRNGMEACENMGGEGIIWVKIMEHKETLCCSIENLATEEMYQRALKRETSKKDRKNHGYGVENIRRAVERLNGEMEYRYKEGKLILNIFI